MTTEEQLRQMAMECADKLACSAWGFFKGDSAGAYEAMKWYEANRDLGGPKHLRERFESDIIDLTTRANQLGKESHKELLREARELLTECRGFISGADQSHHRFNHVGYYETCLRCLPSREFIRRIDAALKGEA
jgi:hypothetical protein